LVATLSVWCFLWCHGRLVQREGSAVSEQAAVRFVVKILWTVWGAAVGERCLAIGVEAGAGAAGGLMLVDTSTTNL